MMISKIFEFPKYVKFPVLVLLCYLMDPLFVTSIKRKLSIKLLFCNKKVKSDYKIMDKSGHQC